VLIEVCLEQSEGFTSRSGVRVQIWLLPETDYTITLPGFGHFIIERNVVERTAIIPDSNICYVLAEIFFGFTIESPSMTHLDVVIVGNMSVQILQDIIRFIFRQFINPFGKPNVNSIFHGTYARLTKSPFHPVTGLVLMTG